jgi:tetratricopeptide (TPR) repeat protein
VLRAQHARPGSDDELEAWETALATGQIMLGEETFELDAGMFWGLLETRPYMRARLGLALTLWQRDRREEAVDHLQAMLELNPGDNQGVRYLLANWLLALDRDSDLMKLLKAYEEEESPALAFSAALGAFRRLGDTAASRKLLAEAIKTNAHVPAFLLGEQAVPKTRPPFYSMGDANEAGDYAIEGHDNWVRSPGALDWLRAHRGTVHATRGPGSGR